ncbi:MAG: 23S rRNA (adenine(2503)-C(2))-methyltransferase RlmN, partial [Candidatus Gracilibacteria bacterium]|nr:23S rRNA (adenine(2503)-C(2))-methyltransferase RlmN [Candidatus Gracilibacteria bacterium]
KDLRERLNQECSLDINSKISKSTDGNTTKTLITLHDGLNIEAVLMRHKGRNTVCVSTQVGCPLNCSFCATGKMGFKRNLEITEIIEQILFFARLLKPHNEKITNIVFMGMGEPFLNYENVLAAIKYLHEKDSLNLGMRHFAISTSGIPDKIRKFADADLEVNLALSLHSADEKIRTKLMPVNKSYPLEKVLDALNYYQQKTRRKIMFEYIMIKGVNDSIDDARKLILLAQKYICVVNLIPYNSSPASRYQPSTTENIVKFKGVLEKGKINVVQRFSYGRDIDAACGQLATKNSKLTAK